MKLRFQIFIRFWTSQAKLRKGKNITNKILHHTRKELYLPDAKRQNKAKPITLVRKLIKTECET